jgi:cysteine desulfurase
MSEMRTYLDWNASARIYPQVVELMSSVLSEGGNASSVHSEGRCAHNHIEAAREQVAQLVNAALRGVIFTSGGSEANSLALSGLAGNGTIDRILISRIEHPSVIASAELKGVKLSLIPVNSDGIVDLAELEATLSKAANAGERVVVSIMWANNETGILQPIEEIVRLAHAHAALVHCDGVQAAGKVPVDFAASGLDLMSLSAHKIGGPQGVGALVVRPSIVLAPMLKGGGQELSRRAGTENLSGIAGFGLAAELIANDNSVSKISHLQGQLEFEIKKIRSDAVIFGEAQKRLPNTTCVAVPGTTAETLLIMLDLAGIAVSSGSACSSGKVASSHVLAAMGVDDALARSGIRISLGRSSTAEDVKKFIDAWSKSVGPAPQQSKEKVSELIDGSG